MNLKISIYALLTLKKPQKDRETEKQREKQREGNEKSTRCEGGRQQKKRENVKLIKMKLSRTQGVRERREREREGRFVAEACNIYNL